MSIFTGKGGYDSKTSWTGRHHETTRESGKLVAKNDIAENDYPTARFLAYSFPNRDVDVLEVGCGYGKWADMLSNYYKTFTGIDVVPERVQQAAEIRKHLRTASFQCVPPNNWQLGRKFDVVMTVTVLQHLNLNQAIATLKSIEQHLKPNGIVLLAEWQITDISLEEAQTRYADQKCPAHMIPKPVSLLKAATNLEWSGTVGRYILRSRS